MKSVRAAEKGLVVEVQVVQLNNQTFFMGLLYQLLRAKNVISQKKVELTAKKLKGVAKKDGKKEVKGEELL